VSERPVIAVEHNYPWLPGSSFSAIMPKASSANPTTLFSIVPWQVEYTRKKRRREWSRISKKSMDISPEAKAYVVSILTIRSSFSTYYVQDSRTTH